MSKIYYILFLLIVCIHAANAQVTVEGKVLDSDTMEPLIGVSIIVKSKPGYGTTTDIDGNYRLEVSEESVLLFSYIGFLAQEVPVGSQTRIDITLQPDLAQLEEVVVVGYGVQKKKDLTTSVVTVDSEDLTKVSSPSFTHSLQGRAPGLIVNSEGGQPGGATSVRIRGYGALNYNEPLYIVDGVILNSYSNGEDNPTSVRGTPSSNPLSSINPSDIASISILKDASATAIYGSRAGNGVVLITTKKGKSGKAEISYDMYYGFQQVVSTIDMMNSMEFTAFAEEARRNAGQVPYLPHTRNTDTLQNTDWQNELFSVAPMASHQISASGGNDKSNYYISAGYMSQDGVIENSNFKRYSARVNLNTKLTDKITVGNNFTYSLAENNTLPNGNFSSGIVAGTLRMPPYIPTQTTIDGREQYYGIGAYEALFVGRISNPIFTINRDLYFNEITKILGNVFVEAEVLEGLKFKTNVSIDNSFSESTIFQPTFEETPYIIPSEAPVGFRDVPRASSRDFNESNTTLDFTLNYVKSFGKHNVSLLAGYTAQEILTSVSNTLSTGHLTNSLITTGAGLPSTQVGSNNRFEVAYQSYIGRANYSYDEKYYLSYTYRRDGSSRFGSGNKFANFHALSGAWRISAEPFFENLTPVFSDVKIRGSIGESGIDGGLSPVEFPKLKNHFTYVFNGDQFATGYAPVGVPNANLRWETARQYDIGVDVELWEGKLVLVADYYNKRQFDIITTVPIPFILGITDETWTTSFPSGVINGPEVVNKGFELAINHRNYISDDFNFQVGANFSAFKNEITDLSNDIVSDPYNGFNVLLNREGLPINQFYGFKADGIITSLDDPALDRQLGAALGDVRYSDLDGNGIIDDADRTVIGSPIPDFTYGINCNVNYKGFDFNMAFQGVAGNEIYNANRGVLLNSKDGGNRLRLMTDRWSDANPNGQYPRAISTDPNNNSRASSLFIEDGSYLRLQNVELGYNLARMAPDKSPFSYLRIYCSGQNLFTFTNYTGYSPEVGSKGIDASTYPLTRRILFGLNAKF